MRFIHIADVHLGATPDSGMPWGDTREKEIWESFRNIISRCNEKKVDLLLIAGDLFHRQPLVRELKEVNYCFSLLENTQVVLMAGNHDYISIRSNYSGFQWDSHVHMITRDSIEKLEFPNIKTEVYGLSYRTRDITESLYDSVRPDNNDRFHILIAHGGDEKDIPMNRKRMMDAGFDYIALGHIHKPEVISGKMAYSGSLEPLDKNEIGKRGHILGEITEDVDRQTAISFVPSSLREYKRLDIMVDPDTTNGSLVDQVREMIHQQGSQHIYSFRIRGLRDEDLHFDLAAVYTLGNVLEVKDETVPDYDFDVLYRENEDNLIGLFIQKIRDSKEQDEITRKALYYGMEALLGAKE